MDPRIFPSWEPTPAQELEPGLRQAVEEIRQVAMPTEALQRALERAGQIPEGTRVRRPWLRRQVVVTALAVAASLLLVIGLWAVLSAIPLGDESPAKVQPSATLGIVPGTSNADRNLGLVHSSGGFEVDRILEPGVKPEQQNENGKLTDARFTRENVARLKLNMTESEVSDLIGMPTQTQELPPVQGQPPLRETAMTWKNKENTLEVRFRYGKVRRIAGLVAGAPIDLADVDN